ncbi:Methyltransferase domain-containing protein [Streptomyces sp. WMMB 714]|uniref:class I SAM-dependent methyltransferase n=1 Tax=Streptomyces sp. WMMB 714 TaxID=1286822 RepID=UPI0005F80709|nr:class I SAM-dependent methyltransferase [Streptomyces sp. WMMB 714]SCK46123.1 Methyltransferase domain-containing protein [Streptomyces sp. WMMB 714]
MPMNRAHRRLCSSEKWARGVREHLLPWALEDVELGEDVLELGSGYGANLRVLVEQVPRLTAVEIDGDTVRRLEEGWGDRARIVHADASALPLPDAAFSSVVCFTMLHHVPATETQDRIFREAFRVLRPGGVFAGCDSQPNLRFRLLHIGDTRNTLVPAELPGRLAAAGFTGVRVDRHPESGGLRFRGRRPADS